MLKNSLNQDEVEIKEAINTMVNCYDITLINEDYTIGNILNYELYIIFYRDLKLLEYVGFKKLHPHDLNSLLRVTLTDKTKGISTVKTMLHKVISEAILKIEGIKGCFDGTRKCAK